MIRKTKMLPPPALRRKDIVEYYKFVSNQPTDVYALHSSHTHIHISLVRNIVGMSLSNRRAELDLRGFMQTCLPFVW